MSNYGYASDNPPRYEVYRYSIKSTNKKLGFNFGFKILYRILKEIKILDVYNLPMKEYVKKGLLEEDYVEMQKGYQHLMTFVIGQAGLNFIKKEVDEYLAENPIPRSKRRSNRRKVEDIF